MRSLKINKDIYRKYGNKNVNRVNQTLHKLNVV